MNPKPWKMSFGRLDIVMSNSTTKLNPPRNGRSKIIWDSRRWELNIQGSRILGRVPYGIAYKKCESTKLSISSWK
jgi:hypothetical protein